LDSPGAKLSSSTARSVMAAWMFITRVLDVYRAARESL
jgi:hypothetical protein